MWGTPNEMLENIRRNVKDYEDGKADIDTFKDIADALAALDKHFSAGGELPDAWKPKPGDR